MRRIAAYRLLVILTLLSGMSGCRKPTEEERIDWSVNLDHTKKTPYGTALAYESFVDYYPKAKRESLTKYFRYTGLDEPENTYADSMHMIVLLGLDFRLTEAEWLKLLRFVRNGNEVFLLTASIDKKIGRDLKLREHHEGRESERLNDWNTGEFSERALSLAPDTAAKYGFTGRYINGWFETGYTDTSKAAMAGDPESGGPADDPENAADQPTSFEAAEGNLLRASIDTQANVLGYSKSGPDFIRYRIGGGHLTLHAAPLALSNYFLLQPENRPYLDGIWHSFPANISRVYWNEFFMRKAERSSLSGLLKFPAMRYALLIAAITLLLYVLFGLKRRQRIVPVIPPLENASVSFVETVGQLYFNKGNHLNLAEKMVQHFLEWVRSKYYLDTSKLDPTFVAQLSMKSGKPHQEVEELINIIHQLRIGSHAGTPEFLHQLYRRIQSFY
jgi:hypothetical protein